VFTQNLRDVPDASPIPNGAERCKQALAQFTAKVIGKSHKNLTAENYPISDIMTPREGN